ncbi:MAG: aspartate-semialdehyde dehydrogenase [Acidobacteriota bacterium]|nr:aspartate-semialdehyde dehydrogenase [Acidobacteriota bacterium]
MERKMEVGILGATGMVGQQFMLQLDRHPWFDVTWLGASQRSEGRRYAEAAPWRLASPMPDMVRDLVVEAAEPGRAPRLVFSALDAGVAGEIEAAFAAAGHIVVSNARNYRMDPVVPLLIPEINPDHLSLLDAQPAARGWSGRIVTNPNCSTVVLAMVLAPLRRFGIRRVMVSTMQAVSGAGYPGVASLDILGNVIPFIDGEEEKIERETQKILGAARQGAIAPHEMVVSAQTTRVPVANGHTEMVSIGFETRPSEADLREALASFTGVPQQLGLPSAPAQPIVYLPERNRPQPGLDVQRGAGMTISVGRLRPCPIFDYKLVALGHNTVRGAAGAAVLNAELMRAEGRLA